MAPTRRRKRRKKGKARPRARSLPPPLPRGVTVVLRPTIGTDGRVPKAAQPWYTEPTFVHLAVLLEEEEPATPEEMEKTIDRYIRPGQEPNFPPPTQPWHQAQEVAYEGWEKKTKRGRARAARKALGISQDTPDGHLLLAHDAASWEEAAALCVQAVAAAERILGADFLTQYEEEFWEYAVTRPYMRARLALGYCLWKQGKRDAAAEHFQALVRLNPGDNQGARYLLAALWLEQGKFDAARRLATRYSPDSLCYWAYNRVLYEFHQRGPSRRAWRRLERAFQQNPFVPLYLAGKWHARSHRIDFVDPGEESEALEYYGIFGDAWRMTEGALEWLAEQFPEPDDLYLGEVDDRTAL